MSNITWHCQAFNALTTADFHDLLQLRINVFVVEQNCPYPELDDKDPKVYHVFAKKDNKVVAVARLVPPGISYTEWSIGRVATHPGFRKQNLGHELMDYCHKQILLLAGKIPVRISAQEYLQKFYELHGYKKVSNMYLEDDIPHIEMLRELPN